MIVAMENALRCGETEEVIFSNKKNIATLMRSFMTGQNIGILHKDLSFVHICCCSSSHWGVIAFKRKRNMSLHVRDPLKIGNDDTDKGAEAHQSGL